MGDCDSNSTASPPASAHTWPSGSPSIPTCRQQRCATLPSLTLTSCVWFCRLQPTNAPRPRKPGALAAGGLNSNTNSASVPLCAAARSAQRSPASCVANVCSARYDCFGSKPHVLHNGARQKYIITNMVNKYDGEQRSAVDPYLSSGHIGDHRYGLLLTCSACSTSIGSCRTPSISQPPRLAGSQAVAAGSQLAQWCNLSRRTKN